jgi:hypothetical protein
MNQTHSIQTSHLNLIWTFVLSSNQYGATLAVHWLGKTLEDIHSKILEAARELSLLQNIQFSPSSHPVSDSMKTLASSLAEKWSGH